MTLLVDELYDGIVFEQNFRINRSMQIVHFRPWIIKWGNPSNCNLVLQIIKDSEVLKEVKIASDLINTLIPSTYFHGQIRFDTEPLQLNHDRKLEWTEYTIKIFTENYVNDTDNFYGTIRRYESKFYDTYGLGVINNESQNDMIEPLGFELFEYTY